MADLNERVLQGRFLQRFLHSIEGALQTARIKDDAPLCADERYMQKRLALGAKEHKHGHDDLQAPPRKRSRNEGWSSDPTSSKDSSGSASSGSVSFLPEGDESSDPFLPSRDQQLSSSLVSALPRALAGALTA